MSGLTFQDKIISSLIAGFLSGIIVGEYVAVSLAVLISLGLAGFGMCYAYLLAQEKRQVLILVGLLLVSFTVGSLRMVYEMQKQNLLSGFEGEKVTVVGVIKTDPTESAYYKNADLLPESIDGSRIDTNFRILIRTSKVVDLSVGDRVVATAVLERPQNFENESGIVFDYINYLRSKHVTHILHKATVEQTGEIDRGVVRTLSVVKKKFVDNIGQTFSFPESALLSGLLLGSKQSLGDDNLEAFRRAGVSHIIVLSGFNIAIVALAIMAITSFLPRAIGFGLALSGVIFFAMMVGGEATVVRATIMVVLALLGKFIGRQYNALRALLIAGALMLFLNPYILIHDVSFELSFVATLALILVSPVLEPFGKWIPGIGGLREIIVSTVSVELLVIPLIVYRMGSVSIVSLFSNLLILPVISPTMLFGFLSATFQFVSHPLSVLLGYPAFLLLRYELWVVDMMSSFKYALLEVSQVSLLVLILIYVGIGIGLYYLRKLSVSQEK